MKNLILSLLGVHALSNNIQGSKSQGKADSSKNFCRDIMYNFG